MRGEEKTRKGHLNKMRQKLKTETQEEKKRQEKINGKKKSVKMSKEDVGDVREGKGEETRGDEETKKVKTRLKTRRDNTREKLRIKV